MTLRTRLSAAYDALFSKAAAPTRAVGGHGTVIYGGMIAEDEKDPSLVGSKKFETFQNLMLNTSIVAASVRYYLNLVAKPTWKVEPIEGPDIDDGEAQAAADLIESALYDMTTPWSRIVRKAALYKLYGFSIQEWTAKRREDGTIVMLDIEARPQHTIELWNLDQSGTLKSVSQRIPQTGNLVELERGKIVYAVDDSLTDSPMGSGLLRHVVKPSKALSVYETLEGYGFEGDLRGVPVGRAPLSELTQLVRAGTITEAEKDAELATIKDFMSKHFKTPQRAVILDSAVYRDSGDTQSPSQTPLYDVDILESNSQTQSEIHTVIERLNREIARILGTEGLLLGNGQGSQALSRDKSHSFGLTVESSLGELTEVMENDVAKVILRLNGIDEKYCPTLKTDAIQYRDLEQVTATLADLATAGAPLMPGDPAIDEVRALAGLSKIPPEILDMQQEIAMRPPPPPPGAVDPNDPNAPNPDEVPDPEDDATGTKKPATTAEANAVADPNEDGKGGSKDKPIAPKKPKPGAKKPAAKKPGAEDDPKKKPTATTKQPHTKKT